jgi:hypothetical protein
METIEVELNYNLSKRMVKELQRFDHLRKDDDNLNYESLVRIQTMLTEHMKKYQFGDYKNETTYT